MAITSSTIRDISMRIIEPDITEAEFYEKTSSGDSSGPRADPKTYNVKLYGGRTYEVTFQEMEGPIDEYHLLEIKENGIPIKQEDYDPVAWDTLSRKISEEITAMKMDEYEAEFGPIDF